MDTGKISGRLTMDAQALIFELANAEELPRKTLKACKEHWDEMVPAFLALLARAADGEELVDEEVAALFFIIHLLAEMKVTAAFVPLMRLLERDEEAIESILGDAITETSHKVIISVFDGSVDALYKVMNNPDVYDFARDSAFRAWTYLVATGVIERDEGERYLRECVDSLGPQEQHFVWISWLDSVAVLGFEDLRPLAKRVCDSGFASPQNMNLDDFERIVEEARSQTDLEEFLRRHRLEPFTDTVGTMSGWYGFSDEFVRKQRQQQNEARSKNLDSATNPYRDIGRNDPCPCGSGKKFKKCCLN